MAKNRFLKLLCSLLLIAANGCFSVYSPPLSGCLYTNVNYSARERGRSDALGAGQVLKHGRNCTWTLVYLNYFWYETGASIAEAMKQGGITRIAAVEYKSQRIFGAAFMHECVIVWGE